MLIDGINWLPIAFVPQLVQATMRDEKTETRRIVRGVPYWDHLTRPIMNWGLSACYVDDDGQAWLDVQTDVDDNTHDELRCPYGKPGDRLWVREAFASLQFSPRPVPYVPCGFRPSKIVDAEAVVFRDGTIKAKAPYVPKLPNVHGDVLSQMKFRPPMHMPFWAHRIGLEVKSIKIERLHEITEAGAVAEGFQVRGDEYDHPVSALKQFRQKWDEINGGRKDRSSGKLFTWELNPFVWVVKFERIKGYHGQEKE